MFVFINKKKMRKKLNLEELSLDLPKIESKETRLLFGGSSYDSGYNENDEIYIQNQTFDSSDDQHDQDINNENQEQDYGENENNQNDDLDQDQDQGDEWGNLDFLQHYFFGGGVPVHLDQIGLRDDVMRSDVYEQVMINVRDQITEYVQQQIALGSNYEGNFQFFWDFNNSYDFTLEDDLFAIGSATLEGDFQGQFVIDENGNISSISGELVINFTDYFQDPADLLNLIPGSWDPVGSNPFLILDSWTENLNFTP